MSSPWWRQRWATRSCSSCRGLTQLPTGAYNAEAFAGVEGCATGYLSLDPPTAAPMSIHQEPDCALESPGSAIAFVRSSSGSILGYAGAMLPSAGASPQTLTLDHRWP